MVPRLHNARAMRTLAERGFTIIELMIVVAIIGILAAVAIPAFTKSSRKAKSSEVPALFGEFKAREESYAMERGSYLGACKAAIGALPDAACVEGDYWPDPLNTNSQMSVSSPPNPRWSALRVSAGKATVYCQYSVIAGPGGQADNMGEIGQMLFQENPGSVPPRKSVPPRNWFYMMARCDWDNDMSENAEYWQRGDLTLLGNNGNTAR